MLNTDFRQRESVATELLLGESASIRAVRTRIDLVAGETASVVITGPSGSGKECVARALHLRGVRADKPFVAINCGAIPRDLIESELFGHERGAFTGAHGTHIGKFEQADGGTLFLDEIGDMPLDVQVRLLRVIEDRSVQRIGGRTPIPVDVRIVSATHRDLDMMIGQGLFREDLFYRLAVVPISLVPLAERREDIALLTAHFIARLAPGRLRIGDSGLDRLEAHDWPGNVRELRNLIERAAVLHPGKTLDACDVEALIARRSRRTTAEPTAAPQLRIDRPIDLASELARIEADYIRTALERSGGVVAATARQLGLRRTTLVEKMRRFDLGRPFAAGLATPI
ncbi:sigma-54-dependent Fis family transcriptional regulator [Sphingomonas sp. SUN039]|uniref:sigma-54 interaction domain-containing protein n=1 Tax=Sphingomonas sp. SUN039 TaxID=2937787 RepID=UPI002164982C|nr:sigma-54 dependent transcriptional regulator [Sphingomonas sp. SUN039]UVO52902.1 sigma-54 dependent transcriptional regulator [Sphingomonas sp. SUN039]